MIDLFGINWKAIESQKLPVKDLTAARANPNNTAPSSVCWRSPTVVPVYCSNILPTFPARSLVRFMTKKASDADKLPWVYQRPAAFVNKYTLRVVKVLFLYSCILCSWVPDSFFNRTGIPITSPSAKSTKSRLCPKISSAKGWQWFSVGSVMIYDTRRNGSNCRQLVRSQMFGF